MNSQLSNLFKVKPGFHRSVQVEHDNVLDGYIVTEAAAHTLQRVANAIKSPLSTRAWSITGPYGSGKSAFIVLLKNLLGHADSVEVRKARQLLQTFDADLHDHLITPSEDGFREKGYCQAIISASREKIEIVFLKALINGVTSFYAKNRGKQPKIVATLQQALLEFNQTHATPTHDQLIEYFHSVVSSIKASKGAGLLLVVDEFGKCLEHVANTVADDVFFLQKIAELASRSDAFPVLFISVLHQSFDRYAEHLEITKRNEWAKIQGRFEDIAFVDSKDQIYKLIASALECQADQAQQHSINAAVDPIFQQLHEILVANGKATSASMDVLKQCLPLHPLTAIAMLPLFRSQITQNARSLFAFLSSSEQGSLIDFMQQNACVLEQGHFSFYCLSDLYDYFVMNYGATCFSQFQGRKWLEINHALSRVDDETQRAIIKSIGILGLISDTSGIAVSKTAIMCALSASSDEAQQHIASGIDALEEQSIIVYRKYNASYLLWGGSDFDLDEKVQQFQSNVITEINLADELNRLFPMQHKVAKRHYYMKGTLRYFSFQYITFESLPERLSTIEDKVDGQILCVLPTTNSKPSSIDELKACFENTSEDAKYQTIIAYIATPLQQLLGLLKDLLALQSIVDTTPELQRDGVAKKEAHARIAHIEQMLDQAVNELLFGQDNSSVRWLYHFKDKGPQIEKALSKRALSNLLSEVCDSVFCDAPLIKNELINRHRLSSNIAAARKQLLHAVLEHSSEANLGFEGFPPQLSIYKNILQESGLHHSANGKQWKFTFDPNSKHLKKSWKPLVKAIDQHLSQFDGTQVPLMDLVERMQKPPFGLRDGIIPIILCVMIKAYSSQLALFHRGTFKPTITPTDFDLIVKLPQRYTVELCRIAGVKAAVFDELLRGIAGGKSNDENSAFNLLDIVKMLFRFVADLPDYTRQTADISPKTKQVRRALLEATDPAKLLYAQLPRACGLEPTSEIETQDSEYAKDFVSQLKESLVELKRKETQLLEHLEKSVFQLFSIDGASQCKKSRNLLCSRASQMREVTVDPFLLGFLKRVADVARIDSATFSSQRSDWLDSIGSLIVGKPLSKWQDSDLIKLNSEFLDISPRLEKLDRLLLAKQTACEDLNETETADIEVLQVSLSSNRMPEQNKIIHRTSSDKEKLQKYQKELQEKLSSLKGDLRSEELIGILGNCILNLMEEQKNDSSNAPTQLHVIDS